MNKIDELIKEKFEEYFLVLSACWFWLLSIIFMLGGLIPENFELTFSFKELLTSFVFANIISLVTSFILAFILTLFSSKKTEKQ